MSVTNQEENMSTATKTAVFAAIIAAAVPSAYGQQTRPMPETHVAVSSHAIQADEMRASKILGSAVYDVQNRNIGSVKDLRHRPHTGR